MITAFLWIANFIVQLPRRGRWEAAGYYAGVFMYALAAKLQRVGIATNQITVNSNRMLGVSGLDIPAVVASLIDNFGQAYTVARVEIVPFVSELMIHTMVRVAYKMADISFTAVNPHPNNIVLTNQSIRIWFVTAYGTAFHYAACMCRLASELAVGTYFASMDFDGINLCTATILLQAHAQGGLAPNPHLQAISAPGQNAFHAFLVQSFAPGVLAVPAANLAANGLDPAVHVSVTQVHNEIVPILDPIANDGFQAGLTVSPPFGLDTWIAQSVELSHQFDLLPCPLSSSGTLSPLAIVTENGGYTSAGAVEPLSMQEWAVSMYLGVNATLVNKNGIPFNFSDPARRVLRYSVPPVHHPRSALIAMLIRDSCKQLNKS